MTNEDRRQIVTASTLRLLDGSKYRGHLSELNFMDDGRLAKITR